MSSSRSYRKDLQVLITFRLAPLRSLGSRSMQVFHGKLALVLFWNSRPALSRGNSLPSISSPEVWYVQLLIIASVAVVA